MTEAEWQESTDLERMLAFRRVSWPRHLFSRLRLLVGLPPGRERKLRLFACACCRPAWHLLSEPSRRALEVNERFADGAATRKQLREATAGALQEWRPFAREGAKGTGPLFSGQAVWMALRLNARPVRARWVGIPPWKAAVEVASRAAAAVGVGVDHPAWRERADWLRDILGNPFRPVKVDSAWRTPPVLALAGSIYQGRAFNRLPELADALEEKGCREAILLDHLRGPGPHVRGCFAVDLILRQH